MRSVRTSVIVTIFALVAGLFALAPTAQADTVVNFTVPGETQWTVPSGVNSIHVVAIGAKGGGASGGAGAVVTADVPVVGGANLYMQVGGNGGDASGDVGGAAGFNGGGTGGDSVGGIAGGGGGGSSSVSACSVSTVCVGYGTILDPRLVVAGGGGGNSVAMIAGAAGAGANATCNVGVDGWGGNFMDQFPGQGGQGGGCSALSPGGAGGSGSGANGNAGSAHDGGDGGDNAGNCAGGGAGGGGYFGGGGGGGGCMSGAGGGGSSSVMSLASNVSMVAATGQPSSISITYAVTAPGAPIDVVAKARNGAAKVSWTPGPSNGSPILLYTVTSSKGVSKVTTNTTMLFRGLKNGRRYTFTVTATNANGVSPASVPSNSVKPHA